MTLLCFFTTDYYTFFLSVPFTFMFVLDGIEAVRRFREQESRLLKTARAEALQKRVDQLRNPLIYGVSTARRRLLVVGMSANCGVDSKHLAKKAGMNFFLGKPFTPSIFMRLMDRVSWGYRSPEPSMCLRSHEGSSMCMQSPEESVRIHTPDPEGFPT